MKKLFTSTLAISSLVLAPALQADDPLTDDSSNEPQVEQPQNDTTQPNNTTQSAAEDQSNDEGTPVGQAANDGSSAAKRKQWQNIALAAGAVAIAVTALILIANNDGHKE